MIPESRVDAAIFRHLLDNSNIPLIGSAFGSTLVATAHMDSPHRPLVLIWLAFVYLTVAIRFWLARRRRLHVQEDEYDRKEALRYALTTSISGIAWGLGGLLVLDDSPIAAVVTITAIQAMVMGGALTLGAFLPAFYAFALPAIMPMVVALAISGTGPHIILAVYSSIFTVLIAGIARRFNRSLRYTWQLTFEKEDLVNALTKAHDQQSALAKSDGLTGMANRRHFDEVLEKEFSRLRRSGGLLSLLMLDVDHFKAFNDKYGHIAGDDCLKRVAEVFRRGVGRVSDLAARYGGEEFVGILPETDNAGAVAVAEQVRSAVESLQIVHESSSTSRYVTVSLGVVTLNCSEVDSTTAVIARTDAQLYRAKTEGRNRIAAI